MKTNIDELVENMFVKVAELEQESKDKNSIQDQLQDWVKENRPELQDVIKPKEILPEKSIIEQTKDAFQPQTAEVDVPAGMSIEQVIKQIIEEDTTPKEKILVLEAVRNNRLGELKMKTDEFFQAASKGDFKKINSLKEEQDSLKTDLDKLDYALEKLYNYFASNTSTFVPKKKISQLSKRAEKHKKCPKCNYVAFTHKGSLVCTNSRCGNYDKEANKEFAKSIKPKKEYEHLDSFTSAKYPLSKRADKEDKFVKLPATDDIETKPDVKSLVDQILAPTKDNKHGALTFSEGYYNIKEWDDSTDVVYLKPIYTETSLSGYRMTYPDGMTHHVSEGEARQLVVSPLETIEASLKPLLKADWDSEISGENDSAVEKDEDGNFFYEGYQVTPIMQAFLDGDPERMKSLIEHGVNYDDPALSELISLFYDGALKEFAPPFEKGHACANLLVSYLDGDSQDQVGTEIKTLSPSKSTEPLDVSMFKEDMDKRLLDKKTDELLKNKFKLNASLFISKRARLGEDDEETISKDYPKSKRNVFYSKSITNTPHGNKEWKQIGDILIHPDKFTALIKTDVNGKTFYTIIDPNGKVIDDEATTLP